MKKLLAILAIVVLGAFAFYLYEQPQISQSPPQKVTFENLPTTLLHNKLITRFPADSSLSLKFYKNSPEDVEHSYIITKNSITLGASDNVDIIILIPSKYINDLTTTNLCETISRAKSNGDLTIKTDLTTKQIALKFLALLPEKECIGL